MFSGIRGSRYWETSNPILCVRHGSWREPKEMSMEETILRSDVRVGNAKQVRDAGLTPGVLHVPGADSVSVQFETAPINKMLTQHGLNAKVWVMIGGEKKFGFIKEVQKSPIDFKILHVVVQIVDQNASVISELPVVFRGREKLESRQLETHMLKTEIKVESKSSSLPEAAVVDVTAKNLGDNITAEDFKFPADVTVLDPADTVYAIVKHVRMTGADATGEDVAAK